MRNIRFERPAREQMEYWERTSASKTKKIARLILDISQTPFDGIGKPEALKHELSGYWSRHISKEHRLVYRVEGDDTIVILSCRFHYE